MNGDTRNAIAEAALNVTRHIHDGRYEAVIVSGASHQLSRALLALAWGARYPGVAVPKVFALGDEANSLLYKVAVPGEEPSEFREWMDAHLPDLGAMRDRRLCLVDDFAMQGYKFRGIRASLRALGFRDVAFAFFAAMGDTELGSEAFVGIRSESAVSELHRLAQNIQDYPEADQLVRHEFGAPFEEYRKIALQELRDIGKAMKR